VERNQEVKTYASGCSQQVQDMVSEMPSHCSLYMPPFYLYVSFRTKDLHRKPTLKDFHRAMDACVFSRYKQLYPHCSEDLGSNWVKNERASFMQKVPYKAAKLSEMNDGTQYITICLKSWPQFSDASALAFPLGIAPPN
jgi:hypothetical protein